MLPSEAIAASMLLGIGDACAKEESEHPHDPDAERPKRSKTATDKYIDEPVTEPGPHDVLCGRGGGKSFYILCQQHLRRC